MTRLSLRRATPLATLLACACPAVALAQAQAPGTELPDKAKDLAFAHAQVVDAPEVPDAIKVRPGERVLLRARASGVQIYVCGRSADGKPEWTLKAPEAELLDEQGAVIGHHGAGPSWRHRDGSAVTGKATAHVDAPDRGSIPWLLVAATSHTGQGVLARVTSVQRINTKGGEPPAASSCSSSGTGRKVKEARVPYRADYYFYVAGAD
jgi:Protein of unknown function (DUF3455)